MATPSVLFVYAVLLFVQILFGVNFVASKIIVGQVDPVLWALTRFVVAGSILFFLGLLLKKGKMNLSFSFLNKVFWLALAGVTISQISFLKGIKLTTSINTSILCSTIPIFTLLIVILRGQEKLTWYKFFGLVLAFSGVLSIRNIEEFTLSNSTFIGDLLVLVNSIGSAFFISYSRNLVRTGSHWWFTTWVFLLGAVQISSYAAFEVQSFAMPVFGPELVFSMFFAIIGATLLTYFLSNWALVHVDSGKVAFFIYLQPVVASFVAWAYLGEQITLRTVMSCLLIILGFGLTLAGGRLSKRFRKIS